MSSMGLPAPINAPWQAAWNHYPAQLMPMNVQTSAQSDAVVPPLTWWRILFVNTQLNNVSGGNPGLGMLQIAVPGSGTINVPQFAPAATGTTVFALWGVGLSPYASSISSTVTATVAVIPDFIWPPGTTITCGYRPAVIGATITNPTLAVEIFTEDADSGALEPAPLAETVASPILV